MPDKITIDELKLYLGTGLKFKRRDRVYTMRGIEQQELSFDLILTESHKAEINEIKPLVRPLSQLAEEIKVDGKRFVPSIELAWSLYRGVPMDELIEPLRFTEALLLASWHFDVFGWLQRTGPDGESLAEVLE